MKRGWAVLLAGLVPFAAGCSSAGSNDASNPPAGTGTSGATDAVTGSINVFAAASLSEAFTTIKKQFEAAHPGTTITLDLDASSNLATQINQGKPADVFASASTRNMDDVVNAGNAQSPTDFAVNTLEIAVPPKNPGNITKLADLTGPGVKVGVCDPAVPCGVVAATVFKNAELTVQPSANLDDVKATLAVVESGEVDAGLVYVTDVRAAGDKVKGVPIPDAVNARTTYPIATTKATRNAALSKAFVDYVLSDDGQQVLTADGFSSP